MFTRLKFWYKVKFRFYTTPFCLLAFAHNFRPQYGAKNMGDDVISTNNWAKMGDSPIAPTFHPWFSPISWDVYKRLRLNQDREFHLGRGSGQSKSTSLRLL